MVWHARLLLAHVHHTTWVILTPDLDRYDEQLDQHNVDYTGFEYLGADGNIPPHIPAGSVYGFQPLAPAVLAYHVQQGQVEAEALRRAMGIVPPPIPGPPGAVGPAPPAPGGVVGAPPAPAVAGANVYVWVALETCGGRQKGDVICVEPAVLPMGHVILGSKAVVPDLAGGNDHCMAKRVLQTEAGNYKLDDLRVLPVGFDMQGTRRREFHAAIPMMVEGTPQGGGLQLEGPPTALNIAKSLRDQHLTPTTYHEYWLRSAEIPKGDRSVYEHEVLSRVFESMVTVDQLNLSGLQSAELIIRRMQVSRESHRVSPSAPDYSSADHFMGWRFRKSAQGIDAALAAHVASALKDEAAISKEARKAKEEQQQRRRGAGKKDQSQGGEGK